MEKEFSSIILKVSYDKIGDTSSIKILGKTMLELVCIALSDSNITAIKYDDSLPLVKTIKPYLDKESEYTVVLYSDTPLITKKTVLEGINACKKDNKNVLKLTRGYIFKTEFIANVDEIYSNDTYYQEVEDFLMAVSFKQIGLISEILKNRILAYHMENGVHFEDLVNTFVDCDVVIGKGVTVAPCNILKGKTKIGDNVTLKSGNVICDCIVEQDCVIDNSNMTRSYIGKNTSIGPCAHLREDNIVGDNCHIGNYVELKKSKIGSNCAIAHLSYVGNVEMGDNCNVGAGVVFANYDGEKKHNTLVGNNVFIGSSSTIIAPLKIEDGAFIAAGSVLTDNVQENALAVARSRQRNILDYNDNKFTSHIHEKEKQPTAQENLDSITQSIEKEEQEGKATPVAEQVASCIDNEQGEQMSIIDTPNQESI